MNSPETQKVFRSLGSLGSLTEKIQIPSDELELKYNDNNDDNFVNSDNIKLGFQKKKNALLRNNNNGLIEGYQINDTTEESNEILDFVYNMELKLDDYCIESYWKVNSDSNEVVNIRPNVMSVPNKYLVASDVVIDEKDEIYYEISEDYAPEISEDYAPEISEHYGIEINESCEPNISEDDGQKLTEHDPPDISEDSGPKLTEHDPPDISADYGPEISED